MALDADSTDTLAEWLALQLDATPAEARPTRLEVRSTTGTPSRGPRLAARIGVELREGPTLDWWRLANDAANLLHGEFAPAHGGDGWWRQLRRPARCSPGAAGAWLLVQAALVAIDGGGERALRERGERLAAEALPGQPLLTAHNRAAPTNALQVHGQLAAGDLWPLLDAARSKPARRNR